MNTFYFWIAVKLIIIYINYRKTHKLHLSRSPVVVMVILEFNWCCPVRYPKHAFLNVAHMQLPTLTFVLLHQSYF